MNKEQLKTLEFVIGKPGMFLINSVEDFNLFLTGFVMSEKSDAQENMNNFIDSFSNFVRNKLDENMGAPFYKVIRYYSSTDSSSLKLLQVCFHEFLGSEGNGAIGTF